MKFDATLKKCIDRDIAVGNVPMLIGEPGIGKSSYVDWLADGAHTMCFTWNCNQLAVKEDITGSRLVPDGDTYKQVFYPHADAMEAVKYALEHPDEHPILFMDEINRTNADVTSALLSLVTARRIGNTTLPDNLRLIIAGNDKGNVTVLDEASISRFVTYRVVPDVATWLAVNEDAHPAIVDVLKNNEELIFCKPLPDIVDNGKSKDDGDDSFMDDFLFVEADGMKQFTCPRTLTYLSEWMNGFTDSELLMMLQDGSSLTSADTTNTLQEAIENHVGHTAFAFELLKHLAETLVAPTNAASVMLTVDKPTVWDNIANLTSRSDMDAAMGALDQKMLSWCLLYAIYDNADNSAVISQLVNHLTTFDEKDMRKFVELTAQRRIDSANTRVLIDSGAPVAATVAGVYNAYYHE